MIQVQYNTIQYTGEINLTFACKTETWGPLHSHALMIPLKSLKFKYQVNRSLKISYAAHVKLAMHE